MKWLLPNWAAVISYMVALLIYDFIKKWWQNRRGWTCPQCEAFRVSGNNTEGLEIIKDHHLRRCSGEG